MPKNPPEYQFPNVWPLPPDPDLEAKTETETMPAAVFQIAVAITLEHEKGYVFDPHDPGGETNFGISKRSYPTIDIAGLTIDHARMIYKIDFWYAPKMDALAAIAPDLAIKAFDLGVNCGPGTAVKFLQRALNVVCCNDFTPRRRSAWREIIAKMTMGKPLAVDGHIGPVTLSVIRECPHENALMAALKGEAYKHYAAGDPRYVAGRLNRLES